MKIVKLNDVCDVRDGTHDSPKYVLEGYPLITSKNIIDGKIDISNVNYISKEDYLTINTRSNVDNGDILMPMIGTIGKPIIVNKEFDFAIKNVALIKFYLDSKVTPSYIKYLLDSNLFKRYVERENRGGTQKFLSLGSIRRFQFPLFSLEEQYKITTILDKLSLIVRSRKKKIYLLDYLIKSQFFEMFGDPVTNSMGLQETELIKVLKLQRGFDLPVQDRDQEGDVPVYGSNGTLGFHNEGKIKGGIITGRSGTIGKVFYTFDKFWPLNTTLFSIETNGNNIIFLSYLLKYYKLDRFYNGTGVPTLNRNIVHKQKIINVPIDSQNQFATFVQQVDKLKFGIQKSLDETQMLFDSLMQKYFE